MVVVVLVLVLVVVNERDRGGGRAAAGFVADFVALLLPFFFLLSFWRGLVAPAYIGWWKLRAAQHFP